MDRPTEQNGSAEKFADVLAGLARLAEAVDRRRYPGRAWRAPARRLRLILWTAGAAAAAALVLLAAYWAGWLRTPASRDGAPDKRIAIRSQPAATQPAEQVPEWQIPAGVDVAAASDLEFGVSRLALPSIGRLAAFDWDIPNVSFTTVGDVQQQERSPSDESKQDSDDGRSGGDGRSGRLDGDRAADGPAATS